MDDGQSPRSVHSNMSSHHSAASIASSAVSSVFSSHLSQQSHASQQSNTTSHSSHSSHISHSSSTSSIIGNQGTNRNSNGNKPVHAFDIPVPDPNRPQPVKYGFVKQKIRNYFLKDWGIYGKQTTWDVTSAFKERHRLRKERDLIKRLRDEKNSREKKEADDKQWLSDNFKHKEYLRNEADKFEKRRLVSKQHAEHRRQVNWKRVHNRETVGRVVAEAAAARRHKEKEDAHNALMEATRIANEKAKQQASNDAARFKKATEDDEEFCDNIARKFGVYEGIPQPSLPDFVPGIPPKQSTLLTVGWIVAEVLMDSDDSEDEADQEDDEDGMSGGVEGRLTADLFLYAYVEILKGAKIGEDGAAALAKVLTPKPKEGHRGGSHDTQQLEPGACENMVKLILRYNNLHLHGTKHIMRMFPKGATPLLQVLDLAGNKLTDSGARYVSEAMSERKALPHLKELDLSSNVITDQGGYTLASGFYQGRCKKLETIKLNDNWMGSKGILAVVRSLSTVPYKKLNLVSLRRNRLRPKMLKRLRDSDNHSKWLSL